MRVLGRALVVIAFLHTAGAAVVWQLGPTVRHSADLAFAHGEDPSRTLVAWVALLCAALAAGCWLWLVAATAATALAALRRARSTPPRWLLAPRLLRAALGLVVGTTLTASPVSPPPSVASEAEGPRHPRPILPGALVGLRLPDRVIGGSAPHRRPHHTHSGAHTTQVRLGDSLWSITSDLMRRPTVVRVARTWPRLYAANRTAIGPDPDLIHPGLDLVVPARLHRHQGGPR